jgi:hypothetical protein
MNLIHRWIPLPKNKKILILDLTSNITGTPVRLARRAAKAGKGKRTTAIPQ